MVLIYFIVLFLLFSLVCNLFILASTH